MTHTQSEAVDSHSVTASTDHIFDVHGPDPKGIEKHKQYTPEQPSMAFNSSDERTAAIADRSEQKRSDQARQLPQEEPTSATDDSDMKMADAGDNLDGAPTVHKPSASRMLTFLEVPSSTDGNSCRST